MIESNIPDVDVNDLLSKVRVEAERLGNLAERQPRESRDRAGANLRNPPGLRPFPRMATPLQPDLARTRDELTRLHDLLERARQASELSRRIPRPFRKLFRQQDNYNALLIQSVIPLFQAVSRLIQCQERLAASLDAHAGWLVDFSLNRGPVEQHIASLQQTVASLQQTAAAIQQNLAFIEQRYTSDASFIKAELSLQGTLIQRQLDGSSVGRESAPDAGNPPAPQADRALDAWYFSFENRFRGNRDEIKSRVRFYLPFLEKAEIGSKSKPILDLGSGRGEWLELLREQGLTAAGIDLNEAMIAQCRERQLNVTLADALEFLRQLPERSQGAVTGFHIIEHLPLEKLVNLLGETLRVLHRGGLAIFESPNCKNLVVGASNFNIDPTHRRPVFPETAQFMLENQGFERVTLEYLAPATPPAAELLQKIPVPIRDLLYGPQDFAVIGYKSSAN
jgi:SAM-dependent methyltransferase